MVKHGQFPNLTSEFHCRLCLFQIRNPTLLPGRFDEKHSGYDISHGVFGGLAYSFDAAKTVPTTLPGDFLTDIQRHDRRTVSHREDLWAADHFDFPKFEYKTAVRRSEFLRGKTQIEGP